jgi:catechol 2,3-dioxygenase-like lactoylglutathione lyase family enzyme
MKLNHMGLAVTDVLATVEMFETYFGLCRVPGMCNAKMGFLTDDGGSLITLFKTNSVVYPKIFHIGFMLGSVEQVNDMHARLAAGGFQPEVAREEHGRFTFYFQAPGGFVVEVNSLADRAGAELRDSVSANNPH